MELKMLSKLRSDNIVVGAWVQIGHIASVEVLAEAGFDWICLDLEHGIISLEQIPGMLSAIEKASAIPFVRLPKNDEVWIHRMLDYGAKGIIAPMINTRYEAERLVNSAKYPPDGFRGFGYSRCNKYGNKFAEYTKSANEQIIIVAQIEHIDAINNLDEILSVKGIDATIIGPYDLSGSLGKPGVFDDNKFVAALDRYRQASLQYGVPSGMHVVNVDKNNICNVISQGYRFIALGTDCVFIYESAKHAMNILRNQDTGHEWF